MLTATAPGSFSAGPPSLVPELLGYAAYPSARLGFAVHFGLEVGAAVEIRPAVAEVAGGAQLARRTERVRTAEIRSSAVSHICGGGQKCVAVAYGQSRRCNGGRPSSSSIVDVVIALASVSVVDRLSCGMGQVPVDDVELRAQID
ncbi:hypothetical protein GCM10012275_37700 [Longimycelium tulufanense]|uniref:Uncharacterized protein n=1 Tax=Longimycelium tulufanense TaxID=907463 RepID=A0A8J3CA58_9PSEU|nr:hypothetical protein GCM10012275_37700 [Longimycelium tulufanense]